MKRTLLFLTVSLLLFSTLCGYSLDIEGDSTGLFYNAEVGYFTITSTENVMQINSDGDILNEVNLRDKEYAFTSPSGNYILVAQYKANTLPVVADITMLDSSGKELWRVDDTVFASAIMSNTGEVLAVAFYGEGPQAEVKATLYSNTGVVIKDFSFPNIGEAIFSENGEVLGVNVPTDEIKVIKTETGEIIGGVNTSQVFTISNDGSMLVSANNNTITSYNTADGSVFYHNISVNIPRLLKMDAEKQLVLVTGKDDISILDLENGDELYTKLPDDGFSIASCDVSDDFSKIVIGAYGKNEQGGVWSFDEGLELNGKYTFDMKKHSANEPDVLLTPDERVWLRTSDEVKEINL
jgi:hypothetical protein